ncbi:MAG: hypothetical protein ACK5ZG_00090 [Phycisphaerae bacterium]|jgi:hypothetical protein
MFTRSLVSLISLALAASAFAQSATTFTYQGELRDGGLPANGSYDVRFRLFDGLTSPTQLGSQLCVDNVAVVDGRFAVTLDFGFQFSSPGRALELEVRNGAAGDCSNAGGFVILAPRQTITSVPAATFSSTSVLATNATLLNNQPASFYSSATNIASGTLADTRLSTNVPRLNAASTTFTGTVAASTFNGSLNGNATTATTAATATNATQLNGQSALFYQNAANLTSGLLADARLSTNVPRLDASNIFSGSSNTFQGTLNARSLINISNPTNALAAAQLLWSADVPTLRISGSGVGAANGLQFSTPGAPTAMRILDTGDIGIGTTAPEAPLHVRGGGTMGGIVVTPDVTDTQSQLVLCENTSASNGMLMRYNGTTNNIEFRGRAADVESTPHLTIGRDSGIVEVPGELRATGGITIPAAERTLWIGAADFQILFNGNHIWGNFATSVANTDLLGGSCTAIANVNLPQGAVVTSIAFLVEDTADINATLKLRRFPYVNPNTVVTMASVTSSGTGGVQTRTDSTVTSPTIDNLAYLYDIELTIPREASGNLFAFGVRVNYTVTTPLP